MIGERPGRASQLSREDLPEPETPVTHVKTPSGERGVDALEVVLGCPFQDQHAPCSCLRFSGSGMDFLPAR